MPYQPADSLKNRTFFGLIFAQFLAGFNDQAIHASAMFFALHRHALTEAEAISLMPILFYAPWAIFVTLAGYFADRFSKRHVIVIWKLAEIVIAVIALAGFLIGPPIGSWVVMSTVFLMGTHAAFFAPAKYGAMPQILQPHVLSRGNGILESTTFLAAILGTPAEYRVRPLIHRISEVAAITRTERYAAEPKARAMHEGIREFVRRPATARGRIDRLE